MVYYKPMSIYKHDVNGLQLATGLTAQFIRRCVRAMPELLKGETIRSDKNKLLFTDNALVIFDRVKQLKQDRLTIGEMKDKLYAGRKQTQVEPATMEKRRSSQAVELYERLISDKDKALNYKDALIQRQQAEIEQLKEQLKLLTYEKRESNPVKAILRRILGN